MSMASTYLLALLNQCKYPPASLKFVSEFSHSTEGLLNLKAGLQNFDIEYIIIAAPLSTRLAAYVDKFTSFSAPVQYPPICPKIWSQFVTLVGPTFRLSVFLHSRKRFDFFTLEPSRHPLDMSRVLLWNLVGRVPLFVIMSSDNIYITAE